MSNISPLSEYELKLYKDLYEKEELRRQQFSGKAYQSITYLIAMISATVWLISKFMKIYPHKPCWLNFITTDLLLLTCVILSIAFLRFFKTLYDYSDLRQNPSKLNNLLISYKSQTTDTIEIIDATNESLVMTYREAAINAYQENKNHMTMFRKFIKTSFVCIIFIAITFAMEVIVYKFF